MKPTRHELTRWLQECGRGDPRAMDRLLPHVYGELRRLANRYLQGERSGHTFQPTALVHEAYLRLFDADVEWRDRVQFFKAAAQSMRRILVDSARAYRADKRGAGQERAVLDPEMNLAAAQRPDLLALDDALKELTRQDERKGQVVELHYFGGLSFEEIAKALEVSVSTVTRDMTLARAVLGKAMSADGP